MWRQNTTLNSDSDQSISDEEFNGDLEDNFIPLNSNTRKEQCLLHQRLEILGGATSYAASSFENKTSLSAEDEVEMPDFPNEDGLILSLKKESACHPDEDIISEEELGYSTENTLDESGMVKQNEASSWAMINKEAEALMHMNENALFSGSLSRENKSHKGVRGKVKPMFSPHLDKPKGGDSLPFIYSDENVELLKVVNEPEGSEPIEDGAIENEIPEFSRGINGGTEKDLNIFPYKEEACRAGIIQHPMAELLDGLPDRNLPQDVNSKMFRRGKGKKSLFVVDKSSLLVGDAIDDNEDQPEMVYAGLSADCEMKKQTMADRFQEAFVVTSFSNDGGLVSAAKLTGIGLFGKLQHVMQSEKERDANFLTKRQMESGCNDETGSIIVKILSRYLEAKLIVCLCSVGTHTEGLFLENSQTLLDIGMRRTVIFNTKVCSDFDLEVGNLIRVHPPWKDVEMMDSHESIILSRYFSHVTE